MDRTFQTGNLFAGLILLAVLMQGCAVSHTQDIVMQDGVACGVIEGAFRHRWWNYYERALSFADCGLYELARQDLNAALRQRVGDQRRARTYGMHFIDYFPQRELGVIFYREGRYEKAVTLLVESLAHQTSAKAELYLNRARQALVYEQDLDRLPPVITLTAPQPPFLTHAFLAEIAGVARDDTYIQRVDIGDQEFPVPRAEPEIHFRLKVPVGPGKNTIPVRVTDISGKVTETLVHLTVDRSGPLIRIDSPADGPLTTSAVMLRASVFDESGLATLTVNGESIPCHGEQELTLEKRLHLPPDTPALVLKATDRAGNLTRAEIDFTGRITETVTPPRVTDRTPPVIRLRNPAEVWATYLDQAFIEGVVQDDVAVDRILINGLALPRSSGRKVYFSHLLGLEEGNNEIDIRALDTSGNGATHPLTILRDVLNVREAGSRLRLGVSAFERQTVGAARDYSHGIEDLLTGAITQRNRFRAVDRRILKELLEELKLSQSGLVDERKALEVGRIQAADGMLFGSVLERVDSVEIYVRLVDTETSQILAAVDVYGENVDIEKLRKLARGLDLKLTDALPLVEGLVVQAEGNRIIVDMGRHTRITDGMKLIVYDIGDPVINPLTGRVIGLDVRELGQARIHSVMENMSFADLIGDANRKAIRPAQAVITR